MSVSTAAAVAVVVVTALSACSGAPGVRDTGIASRSNSGFPVGVELPSDGRTAEPLPTDPPLVTIDPSSIAPSPATVSPEDLAPTGLPDPEVSPWAAWVDEGTFAVVTFGSSSCPAAPATLNATGVGTLDIGLKATGGDVCTADMAATTFEIDDPEGLDPSVTYSVTFDGESGGVLEPLS